MSYTPHEWSTGETITAAKLNALENGVAAGGGGNPLVTLTFPYGAGSFSKFFSFCIVDGDDNAVKLAVSGDVTYAYSYIFINSFTNGESVFVPLPLPARSGDMRLMFVENEYIYSFSGSIDQTSETIHIDGSTATAHEITGDCTISVEWE